MLLWPVLHRTRNLYGVDLTGGEYPEKVKAHGMTELPVLVLLAVRISCFDPQEDVSRGLCLGYQFYQRGIFFKL